MINENAIRQRWEAVGSKLDERGRRLFAAAEARSAGWGGLAARGGAPKGNTNALKHGEFSAETLALTREIQALAPTRDDCRD